MKKKTFDRATLEAQISAIERDDVFKGSLKGMAIIAMLVIAVMVFSSCASQYHCRPEYMVGYGDKKK